MSDRFNSRDNCRCNSRRMENALSTLNNSNGNCGEGCNNGNSVNCKNLQHRLQTLDFSIIDTVLYLNAYPDSVEALNYYKKLISERDGLKRSLAQSCNMPTTSFENSSTDNWNWINGPWPWELAAN